MKRAAALVICATLLVPPASAADDPPPGSNVPGGGLWMTGQRLAELCEGKTGADQPDTFGGGTCLGYINGTAATLLLYGVICYNHVTNGQVSDTVVKYMNEHPTEIGRHIAIVLIGIALKAAYPVTADCRKSIGDTRPVP
jgi:hypothetical protein